MTQSAALGIYFQVLREHRQDAGRPMSAARLAVLLGDFLGKEVNPTTVWRIESGDQRPGGDMLTALIDVLGGSFEDVRRLIRERGTAEDARRFAMARLNNDQKARIADLSAQIETEGQLEALIADWRASHATSGEVH